MSFCLWDFGLHTYILQHYPLFAKIYVCMRGFLFSQRPLPPPFHPSSCGYDAGIEACCVIRSWPEFKSRAHKRCATRKPMGLSSWCGQRRVPNTVCWMKKLSNKHLYLLPRNLRHFAAAWNVTRPISVLWRDKACSYGRLLADPHHCWPCFVFRKLWIATLILICPHIYCNDDFLPHLARSAREVWRLEVLLGSAIAAICPHCNPPVTPPPPSVLAHCKSCLLLQQLPIDKELWSNLFRL